MVTESRLWHNLFLFHYITSFTIVNVQCHTQFFTAVAFVENLAPLLATFCNFRQLIATFVNLWQLPATFVNCFTYFSTFTRCGNFCKLTATTCLTLIRALVKGSFAILAKTFTFFWNVHTPVQTHTSCHHKAGWGRIFEYIHIWFEILFQILVPVRAY